jgi:flagellar hook-basal body complex protein FliE
MRSEIEMRIHGPAGVDGALEAPAGGGAPGAFARELGAAIDGVDKLQVAADQEAERVAQGGGNLHELAIALEKADVGMRVAMKVRNKIVDAYTEIMRMSV